MEQRNIDPHDPYADITDPDLYMRGVPHAAFKRLRDDDPVSWWEERDGRGFWAVTRYNDLLTVNLSPRLFSSASGIRYEEMSAEELQARRTLMEMDPPQHAQYRRLVASPFAPREVAAYEEGLRWLARAVIDEVRERKEFDFVTDIARQLPMRMLGKLLGVPDEDGLWLVEKGDALIGNSDPELTSHPVDQVSTNAYRLMPFRSPVSSELFAYADSQARQRREHPRDDVISLLLRAKKDGEPLSDQEFKNFFTLLVAAGNDTTRYTMAAGLLALIERPEQLSELRENPALMPTAVEEMLRWGSVTMHFRRTATQDIELGGKQVKAGDKVVIWFLSADYDERRFPDPYSFDIRRTPNEHAAFGLKGPHRCIGEYLARIEIRVLFEVLLPLLSDIRLNGPVARLRSNFIAGIKHLPVKVSWA
ncbi:MAG TPA: cytochrome P450 [Ktedonosporobacter sp.]|nr:cytochrome P450 [Ktedonosporobacter sp.]